MADPRTFYYQAIMQWLIKNDLREEIPMLNGLMEEPPNEQSIESMKNLYQAMVELGGEPPNRERGGPIDTGLKYRHHGFRR